ncbi:MAG TPA: hypothetical protein VG405_04235, partial [Solirubrobacteraceae bacterium]|nr:hypothetical protein [Solirubrobacteraceae bacterium]
MPAIRRRLVWVNQVIRASAKVLAAPAVVVLLLVGCGAHRHVLSSGCGPSYTFGIHGHSTEFGCDGAVSAPQQPIRL